MGALALRVAGHAHPLRKHPQVLLQLRSLTSESLKDLSCASVGLVAPFQLIDCLLQEPLPTSSLNPLLPKCLGVHKEPSRGAARVEALGLGHGHMAGQRSEPLELGLTKVLLQPHVQVLLAGLALGDQLVEVACLVAD